MNKAIEYVWDVISFPEASILEKRVPKKQFLESGELVSSDKKLFRDNVKNVYWEYSLKTSTCPVLPLKDKEREYLEVAILQVELELEKGYKRIAEIIHRLIPYPLMIGFSTGSDEFALSIAPKRFSQAEHGAFVVEKIMTTDWVKYDNLGECEADFIKSLAWGNLPLQNYGVLYNAWEERFIAYESSRMSGTFTIGNGEKRFEILASCREIEYELSELRKELKQAAFNRQVEINMKIKNLEKKLKHFIDYL